MNGIDIIGGVIVKKQTE